MNNSSNVKKPPKLSVVVIAYNNELYIEEALESLHEQTFEDMEVIVVDDASTDRTGELIDNFIADKPKFKVIHLQNNSGGCSVPRNTGIAHSSGEYVMFLDGDDWYTVDACEKMVAAIERTGSDIVAGQVIRTNTYEIWYYNQIYSRERTNINIREFSELIFDSLSVNKIYRRSFLDKHHLRFPEGIHYEDIVFTGKAYFLADSISIIPEPVYYWRVVENAKVKSITNRRLDFDNFKNRITAHRMLDQFLRENGDVIYQANKNNKFLRHDLKLYVNDYPLFDEKYKNRFHELIYEYMHEVMNKYEFLKLGENDRIMYYLLYIDDREAFQDYVAYIKGKPTSVNRIYCIGNTYYFNSFKSNKNERKFLEISQPKVSLQLKDIKLNHEEFSFRANVKLDSIADSEITYSFELKNKKTGISLSSQLKEGNQFSFPLNHAEPGIYHLTLWINHYGNLHERKVYGTDFHHFPNLKADTRKFVITTDLTKKNVVALNVQPKMIFDQIKWKAKRMISEQPPEPVQMISEKVKNILKNGIKKLPVRENWIFFESHMGKQYSDSPKYIYEELCKSNKKYKYIWSFENPGDFDLAGHTKKVKRGSLKHYYYLSRSKYWVDNQGMAHIMKKRKNQVYLQTWHGTPLKKMGFDQSKPLGVREVERLEINTRSWDYFISPNPYSTEIFRRAFRYGGKILETGYPRNDILIRKPEALIQKVRDFFGITAQQKVVLFAPTFRDWDENSFQKTLNDIYTLSKRLDENTTLLLRLHYLLSNKLSQSVLTGRIINASSYPDIQELYLIADVLVTDYSSVMFDYALLKRPIILYCYDLEEYRTRRGLYFDLAEKGPGPVCKTIEEVIDYLTDREKLKPYEKSLERFNDEFGKYEDGQATRKVIEAVFK